MNRGSCLRSFALALLVAFAGCGPSGTPEERVRALVDAAETAAEARDASALKDLVADDYQDREGRTAGDLRNFLHGWLAAHPSVNLLTRIDALEFEGTELARVEVTVGLLGRESKGTSDWSVAFEVERLELRLERENDEWRVIGASRL